MLFQNSVLHSLYKNHVFTQFVTSTNKYLLTLQRKNISFNRRKTTIRMSKVVPTLSHTYLHVVDSYVLFKTFIFSEKICVSKRYFQILCIVEPASRYMRIMKST
jgi:hypothetical protein